MNRFSGTDKAPYFRFRPSAYWGDVFPGGAYTADIMGCPWTCDHCWSKFGYRNVPARYEHTPAEVVTKLVEGMKRNVQCVARISGGEPGMWWGSHMVPVIGDFLARTEGREIQFDEGAQIPFHLGIETNGALQSPEQFTQLVEANGQEVARVTIAIGMKSTTPEGLSELTGLSLASAQRSHERQLENALHIAEECKPLGLSVLFIDKFTDLGLMAALQRELERLRPGTGRAVEILEYRYFGNATRFYTPKRHRKQFPDELPEEDDETNLTLMNRDGSRKDPEPEPAISEERSSMITRAAAQLKAQGLPEGEVR
jgi:uncharacterized Fe-S cluster-containing radical SAM superfamily protein